MAGPREKGGKGGGEVVPLRPTRPCPICGKPSARTYYPFCSERCGDVDLNRWLSGSYSIPGSQEEDSTDRQADTDSEN
jgi:endogenous inhibitor of DNA gyrase (YacG/DUF329 family)